MKTAFKKFLLAAAFFSSSVSAHAEQSQKDWSAGITALISNKSGHFEADTINTDAEATKFSDTFRLPQATADAFVVDGDKIQYGDVKGLEKFGLVSGAEFMGGDKAAVPVSGNSVTLQADLRKFFSNCMVAGLSIGWESSSFGSNTKSHFESSGSFAPEVAEKKLPEDLLTPSVMNTAAFELLFKNKIFAQAHVGYNFVGECYSVIATIFAELARQGVEANISMDSKFNLFDKEPEDYQQGSSEASISDNMIGFGGGVAVNMLFNSHFGIVVSVKKNFYSASKTWEDGDFEIENPKYQDLTASVGFSLSF